MPGVGRERRADRVEQEGAVDLAALVDALDRYDRVGEHAYAALYLALHRLVGRARLAVRTFLGDGVVRVDDRNDPGPEWDLVTAKVVWIAAAVPSLVVGSDNGRHELSKLQRLDDRRPDPGMLAHVRPVLLVERPGLEEHVLRHADEHCRQTNGVARQGVERFAALAHERGAQEEIAREVPDERELRRHRQIGAGVGRGAERVHDQRPVALEIANGRVDLQQRDLHVVVRS